MKNTEKCYANMIIKGLLSILCLCILFNFEVSAEDKYVITDDSETGLTATLNDRPLTDAYVSVVKNGSGYKVVKPCTKKSVVYYFDRDGKGSEFTQTEFVKISYDGKRRVYYSKKGTLLKNQIVGSKRTGYYYVDTTGVRITDKTTKLAVKFVRAHTKSTDSQSKKLSKCYYYLAKNYKYSRTYTNLYPKAKDMESLAYDMFKNKRGNCHRYAASFAYIARVLGYDAKVVVGKVSSNHGGMTPHGWDEIKNDGRWYVCDPDMEYNNGVSGYMKTETPCKTSVTRRCSIIAKNGKIIWK